VLKAENISKTFVHRHNNVTGLKSVFLEVKEGEFVSITGPSGSGKSTLLLTLGGMSAPTEGKILWNNESVYDWDQAKRASWRGKTIGFVFQTFNLIPYLNVLENVRISLKLSGNGAASDSTDVLALLEKMKLSDRLQHNPKELSVGQQQRVALARALVKNPQVILADEPTGNLDPETACEILALLQAMNKEGKTIVLVTHDPHIAKLAQRNVRIVEGELCWATNAA
jgi:putative ABC transport system ATP-binding protein